MTTSTPGQTTEPLKEDTKASVLNPKKRPISDNDSDAEKLAARREANRIHALKSRQRSKALLQELQRTVTQLSGEKAELERENAVMRAQIEVLQQQNLALTQSQRMLLMRAGAGQLGGTQSPANAAAAMTSFAPGLFGLSQAASMPSAAPAPNNTANNNNHNNNGAPNPSANTSATTATAAANKNPKEGAAPIPSPFEQGAAMAAAAQAMMQTGGAAGFPFQQFMGTMAAALANNGVAAPTTNQDNAPALSEGASQDATPGKNAGEDLGME